MAKRKFTSRELNEHLENIDIYWHKHGGEEREELQEFLTAIFEALPADRTLGDVAPTTGTIEIKLDGLTAALNGALEGLYDEDEVSGEVDSIADRCIELGGERWFENLITDENSFSRAFEEHFSEDILSDEAYARVDAVRKAALAGAAPVDFNRPQSGGDAAETLEINLQTLLSGLFSVYEEDEEEEKIRATVDEFLAELQGRGGHVNGVRLTASRDLFQYLFPRYFSSSDESINGQLQVLSESLFGDRSAANNGW